jgi:outer membrane protein
MRSLGSTFFGAGLDQLCGIGYAHPPMHSPARSPFVAALVFGLCLFATTARAEIKVAVVDVQRAVMQTEEGLRAQATLKKLFDSRQQELNKRQSDMQKQKEDIDKQSKVLSQQALQKKVDDWQKEMVELQTTFVEYNKELEKKQKELTDPIFERVLGAIKRLAGQESYDLIVDRATVAYSRGDLDLTDRVIQLANGVPAGGTSAPGVGPGAVPTSSVHQKQ